MKCSKACEAFLYLTIKAIRPTFWESLPKLKCPVTVAAGRQELHPASVANQAQLLTPHISNCRIERSDLFYRLSIHFRTTLFNSLGQALAG